MAQYVGKTHYAEVVEHFFRMAVRYEKVRLGTPFDWFNFTKDWIRKLSADQQDFIESVFCDMNLSTMEALYAYQRNVPMYEKKAILSELERQYAIDSGLI